MGKIKENFTFNTKMLDEPISYAILVALGFSEHGLGYYCPPYPAHGGLYRIKEKGSGVYQVYLTDNDATVVREVNTMGQLNNVQLGFCDTVLFNINQY